MRARTDEKTRLLGIRIGRANRMFLIRNSRNDTASRLRHRDNLRTRHRSFGVHDNQQLSRRKLMTALKIAPESFLIAWW
jgi:hypothetical protein